MPQSTLALKSSVTRRQAAQPAQPDAAERQAQQQHHQAATATTEEKSGKQLRREANELQNSFLGAYLNHSVAVFLVNGIKLVGRIRRFDQFTLLLEGPDGSEQLVFKHALTTIQSSERRSHDG